MNPWPVARCPLPVFGRRAPGQHTGHGLRATDHGFTLLEVLIGLAILGLVITTSLAIFYERERRLRSAEETIVAYQILANEAEVQRQIPYSQLVPDETYSFMSEPLMLARLRNAVAETSVEQTHFTYKTLTLTIRWNDGARVAKLSVIRSNTGGSNLW